MKANYVGKGSKAYIKNIDIYLHLKGKHADVL